MAFVFEYLHKNLIQVQISRKNDIFLLFDHAIKPTTPTLAGYRSNKE